MTHTTMSLRRLASGIALAAVLPLTAACSGGSSPTAAGTPTAPAATSAAATIPTSTTATTATTTTNAPAAGADAAYCATLKTAWAELETMTGNIGDGGALGRGLAVLGKVEAVAPAEVKPAWGDFIAFIETAASGDTKGMTEAMPKMESAGTKIESHARTACGIDLGS